MTLDFGPVILGGNVFGWTITSPAEAFKVLDAFVAQGGKSIDTADVYVAWLPGNVGGESETLIGQWLASRKNRHQVSIATKVAKWPKQPGLSAKNIREAIDGSLKRLQTDFIDLYYAHEDDTKVEQGEYLEAFDGLVKAGKLRVLGASNFTADRLESAIALSKKNDWAAFEVAQDEWSLVERGIEKTLVPTLETLNLVELPYFSLGSGFLTGKYRPGQKVDSARAGRAEKYLADAKNVALLEQLDALAEKYNVSVTAISLSWLRGQKVVGAPIASARTVEQIGPLLESGRVTLTPDELHSLSRR